MSPAPVAGWQADFKIRPDMSQAATTACTLPYPARFEAAQKFQESSAAGESFVNMEHVGCPPSGRSLSLQKSSKVRLVALGIVSDPICYAGPGLAKDETKLLLYALQQQAKHGPCK